MAKDDKWVYDFDEGSKDMRDLLGGKGANVAEMTRVLGADRVPAGFTITDTVSDPDAKPLAYGKSTTFGRLKCTSRTTGITCKSLRSYHGFTVSTSNQRVF